MTSSQASQQKQKVNQSRRNWLWRLYQPSKYAKNFDKQRRSQLMAVILMFFMVLLLGRWLVGELFEPVVSLGYWVTAVYFIIFLSAFIINRTKYFQWTIPIVVFASIMFPFVLLLLTPNDDTRAPFQVLVWLSISILLISSLFSLKTAVILIVAVNLIYLSLSFFTEELTLLAGFTLVTYLGAFSVLLLIQKKYRNLLEEDRQKVLSDSEARYRSLFENAPISLWENDYSDVKRLVDDLKQSERENIEGYMAENREFLPKCIDAVKILDMNQITMELLETDSKEILKANVKSLVRKDGIRMFRRELIALMFGNETPSSEVQIKTMKGDTLHVLRNIRVADGYESSWGKMLVSSIDITELKKAERAIQWERDFALQVMQSMGEGLTITDENAKYEFVNQFFCRMLGYEAEDLIGTMAFEHVDESSLKEMNHAFSTRMQGQSSSYETVLKCSDGSKKSVWVAGVPRIVDGKYSGAIAVVSDLTKRKAIEEQLRQRNQQLLELQKASHVMASSLELGLVLETSAIELAGLLKVDACHIYEWNSAQKGIRLIGSYPERKWENGSGQFGEFQKVELPIHQLVLAEKVTKQLRLLEIEKSALEREYMLEKKLKTLLVLPMFYQGKLLGFIELCDSKESKVFSAQDIALVQLLANQAAIGVQNARLYERAQVEIGYRAEIEERQEELIAELERKNEELERFTYTVSHDLKSPLVTVRGFLGYLTADIADEDWESVQRDIDFIQDATGKMHELLNELLELSRLGKVVNPPQFVVFNDLVDDALFNVTGQISEKQVDVIIEPNMPKVFVDRPRIIEVLQNLLDNSVKFMGDQLQPRIEIGTRVIEGDIAFFVHDNGMGIEEQYLDSVFDLFDRIHPEIEGTGIGLALVKRIVELHNGRIWIESEGSGNGTTILFALPLVG